MGWARWGCKQDNEGIIEPVDQKSQKNEREKKQKRRAKEKD